MYNFNWILYNELAVSSAPIKKKHFAFLNEKKIRSILNLCYEEEIEIDRDLSREFTIVRYPLPDHKKNQPPLISDITNALDILSSFDSNNPILVHCFAGIERSPLICAGWLIRKFGYNIYEALDYVKQSHPPACPLDYQIEVLRDI